MAATCHKSPPRVGEAVYDVARRFKQKQPNGVLVRVDYEDHEVIVAYPGKDREGYDFDELEWDDSMGGKWIIGEEGEVNRQNVSKLPHLGSKSQA